MRASQLAGVHIGRTIKVTMDDDSVVTGQLQNITHKVDLDYVLFERLPHAHLMGLTLEVGPHLLNVLPEVKIELMPGGSRKPVTVTE